MDPDLLSRLGEVVGGDNVTDVTAGYGQDWTRFYTPRPGAVVFARDAAQIVRLVKFANRHGLALVPSGGRTGLSGGAVAAHGEVVVSFDKMNRVVDFDEVDRIVTVEAGVVTATLQDFAADKGLCYPVDFASSGSSQVGGNIATNAGGIKVLRYGLTRDQVVGLKVVTGKGELLELNRGLVKNATGYDFRHLFIGSEGTLGIIVEAMIRLTRRPDDAVALLLAVPDMGQVMNVFGRFRAAVHLTAYEFFSNEALSHVVRHVAVSHPFETPSAFYVLLEFENRTGEEERAVNAFEDCRRKGWVMDGIISQSERQRFDLWRYREDISESITRFTPWKNDISVRVSRVPAFLEAVQAEVEDRYPAFEVIWFGHIGDGNLHLNILKPEEWTVDAFRRECEVVGKHVMEIVRRYEGSVSAEHGVGLLKHDQLGFTRSEEEISLMRAVKHVFDPNGVMNPGKLI